MLNLLLRLDQLPTDLPPFLDRTLIQRDKASSAPFNPFRDRLVDTASSSKYFYGSFRCFISH